MIKKNPFKFYLRTNTVLILLTLSISSYTQLLSKESLDTCKIYKSIEQAKANPKAVYILDLSKKKLSAIPNEISLFKNLQVLKLSKNKISNIDTSISFPLLIQEINLSRNKLELFPLKVLTLSNLKRLILNQNIIKNIPDGINELQNLIYLDMWSNNLSKISNNIKFLNKLEELDLRVIMFSNKEKERIRNLIPNAKVHFSNSCNCGY
tara:strand:+ start:17 stop:640 length:624 start_codon:yes stop_codon:yes gene_type:complete